MRKTYRLHPGEYAIGENEHFYEEMARRGWQLEKRGAYFSRFVRTEPQDRCYRIELSSPDFLDGQQEMPEEQVALYEECGWQLVTRSGLVHVFSAPADSDLPEFYADPRQQAATLKALRRSYWLCWLPPLFILAFQLLLAYGMAGNSSQGMLTDFLLDLRLEWVRSTALILLYAALLTDALYHMLYGAVRTMLLYHHLKRGRPINRAPRKRIVHRVISVTLLACCVFSGVMQLWQLMNTQRAELPGQADGSYLLLEDLGWEGERRPFVYSDNPSAVEHSRSLMADYWNVKECVAVEADQAWMTQQIYRLRTPDQARALAPSLMADNILAHGPENFTRIEVPGLDEAYVCDYEYVVIKGRYACAVTYRDPACYSPDGSSVDVLAAYAILLNS